MPIWDSKQYLKFANERTQPVLDLIHRIDLTAPQNIIDLGCGPGNSTQAIRQRWPKAVITGLDSSPHMIETAQKTYPNEHWQVADAATWQPTEHFDLILANAMLQWLHNHAEACHHWFAQLQTGGALAVQVPMHYDFPVHKEIVQISTDPAWNDRMHAARVALTAHPAEFYYTIFHSLAVRIDIWETTYYHVLAGSESVLEWFRGTGLRPFLEALSSTEERERFEQLLLERYRIAYPRQPNGKILFPFRRLFFVVYK